MTNLFGNYIGDDIEVVILKKYSLVYLYDKNKNTIESYLLYTDGFSCKAACITEANTWIDNGQSEKILFFRDISGNAFSNSNKMNELHNISLVSVEQRDDSYIFTMYDGRAYSSVRHENYTDGDVLPNITSATDENIASCLQTWHLGLRERQINDMVVGVEINTLKHMYIFDITDNFIYCRAARYATCNKGIVFSQNFRQNFHDFVGQSFAMKNNKKALEDVTVDKELFNPIQCVFSQNDIYWSVLKVEEDVIYLNGCGGETYIWRKPQI